MATCSVCGRSFDENDQTVPGLLKGKYYCCDNCADSVFIKKCLFCKKEFSTFEDNFDYIKKGFCSSKCQTDHYNSPEQVAKRKAEEERKAAEEERKAAEEKKKQEALKLKKQAEEELKKKQEQEAKERARKAAEQKRIMEEVARRIAQEEKEFRDVLIKIILSVVIGIISLIYVTCGMKSCGSSKKENAAKAPVEPAVEYVFGTDLEKPFRISGASLNWDYEAKTMTIKVKELRNISSNQTGSLRLAVYALDKPYQGGTASGKITEGDIAINGLQPNYGWNDKEWTFNFRKSVPDAGEKYLLLYVLEYMKNDEGNGTWYLCGKNYVQWKNPVKWNPAK